MHTYKLWLLHEQIIFWTHEKHIRMSDLTQTGKFTDAIATNAIIISGWQYDQFLDKKKIYLYRYIYIDQKWQ